MDGHMDRQTDRYTHTHTKGQDDRLTTRTCETQRLPRKGLTLRFEEFWKVSFSDSTVS